MIVAIDNETQHNHLDLLYVKSDTQGKGIGKAALDEGFNVLVGHNNMGADLRDINSMRDDPVIGFVAIGLTDPVFPNDTCVGKVGDAAAGFNDKLVILPRIALPQLRKGDRIDTAVAHGTHSGFGQIHRPFSTVADTYDGGIQAFVSVI